jgi:hypothetical protein
MHDWGLGNSVHVRISMSVPLYASARVFAAAMWRGWIGSGWIDIDTGSGDGALGFGACNMQHAIGNRQ